MHESFTLVKSPCGFWNGLVAQTPADLLQIILSCQLQGVKDGFGACADLSPVTTRVVVIFLARKINTCCLQWVWYGLFGTPLPSTFFVRFLVLSNATSVNSGDA